MTCLTPGHKDHGPDLSLLDTNQLLSQFTATLALPRHAAIHLPGTALPQGFEAQALVQLLGCGLGAGAASSLALKQLAGMCRGKA